MKENLTKIDEEIIASLKGAGKSLTTYKIAKETEISWSAINSHCYKLMVEGILKLTTINSRYGGKKSLWWIKKEDLPRT